MTRGQKFVQIAKNDKRLSVWRFGVSFSPQLHGVSGISFRKQWHEQKILKFFLCKENPTSQMLIWHSF